MIPSYYKIENLALCPVRRTLGLKGLIRFSYSQKPLVLTAPKEIIFVDSLSYFGPLSLHLANDHKTILDVYFVLR